MKGFLTTCLLLLATGPALAQQTVVSFSSGGMDDWVGQGQTKAYTPVNGYIVVAGTRGSGAVSVQVSGNDGKWWDLHLKAPIGEQLVPREYFFAERAVFTTGRSPGLDFSGDGRGCNEIYGSFAIRQIAYDSAGNISMLEASALQYCETPATSPLALVVRWRAPYKSFTVASESSKEWVGQGIKKKYFNDTSTLGISTGAIDYFHFVVSGMRDHWMVTLSPPLGQTYFKKGTYYTLRSRAGTLAGMDISANSRGCNQSSGRLDIIDIAYRADGTVSRLYADFSFYCESTTRSGPVLKGNIRYSK